jgi:DNA-binding Lrp family transcriptional regulator
MAFAAIGEYTEKESKIMELLKKQPDLSNRQIAEALKYDLDSVNNIVENLLKKQVIAAEVAGGIPIRKVLERLPAQTLPEFKVMYTYEKRADVSGPELLKTSRPFCVKMVGLSQTRMFSREDIQKLSERLGYSVFKRAGGFWNNNGTIEFQCRHGWMKHVVIKKK